MVRITPGADFRNFTSKKVENRPRLPCYALEVGKAASNLLFNFRDYWWSLSCCWWYSLLFLGVNDLKTIRSARYPWVWSTNCMLLIQALSFLDFSCSLIPFVRIDVCHIANKMHTWKQATHSKMCLRKQPHSHCIVRSFILILIALALRRRSPKIDLWQLLSTNLCPTMPLTNLPPRVTLILSEIFHQNPSSFQILAHALLWMWAGIKVLRAGILTPPQAIDDEKPWPGCWRSRVASFH